MQITKIHPLDNVGVALCNLEKGTVLQVQQEVVTLAEPIGQAHKVAIRPIAEGEMVVKYGYPIGTATQAIGAGEWVHTHNIKTNLDDTLSYAYEPEFEYLSGGEGATFQGYRRADGKVGIRNEVWILPTVGCVNAIAEEVVRDMKAYAKDKVDCIHAFVHPYGCSQLGEDHLYTQKALAALAKHPNATQVIIFGLGCENNHIATFKEVLGAYDSERIHFLEAQAVEDEYAVLSDMLKTCIDKASEVEREVLPASELIIGLKCGGSDGFSGITANPLVGLFSDRLIGEGGTTILTEVPEMFGAETILMNRCVDEATFDKTVALINDFKAYFKRHDQVVYENPSPGNKKGGITTLEDKSLGCTQKGGSAPVVDVLGYGDSVKQKGLNLLQSPGNDLVASTALALAGAHIVLFTTGRGTPFGSPVPTMKIASNTQLYTHKKGWMDFDAGRLLQEGQHTVSDDFFQAILAIASGAQTLSEKRGYKDFAIFKQGVTL